MLWPFRPICESVGGWAERFGEIIELQFFQPIFQLRFGIRFFILRFLLFCIIHCISNKSFYGMNNTTLEAVNIYTDLSFTPGLCVEMNCCMNLYYNIFIYLLNCKRKVNTTLADLQSVTVTNPQNIIINI